MGSMSTRSWRDLQGAHEGETPPPSRHVDPRCRMAFPNRTIQFASFVLSDSHKQRRIPLDKHINPPTTMQNQQEPPQPVPLASPLAPPAANDPSLTSTELSALQEVGMDLENDGDTMDVSVDDVSEALHELGTSPAPAVAVIELDDEDDNAKDEEEEEKADADMGDDDSDGDDSDSDYDLDKDLEDFDEEDDNDEVDEDERFHYFQSLAMEIEDSKAQERDVYMTNMLAQRDRLTGEEAVWVDKFLKEQEEWKQQNGKSVDDHTRIQALAKFIPDKLERKRPVRATRK